MRIIFMGTPEFAVPSLKALVSAGHEVVAVYSQPPRPAGRKMALTPSPVHAKAEAMGLRVLTPKSLRNEAVQSELAAFQADIAVVAAYGLILPQAILDAPKHGCINVHASLLPRWRGAAPVQRSILAGDEVTGVTIMGMEAGLDTGPMFARVETPIASKTAAELTSELAQLGAELLVNVLGNLAGFAPEPQPDEGVTYATKIDKSETHLDFLVSATQIERQIRAFAPTAWFQHAGERFRILKAEVLPPRETAQGPSPACVIDDALTIACNPGAIRPNIIQRAGKPAMPVSDFLRGFAIESGTKLT